MLLNLYIEDQPCPLEVPEEILEEGRDFFDQMDRDMDRGWQMSHTWVEELNQVQRCQVAADRLLQALTDGKGHLLLLMAGYILSRLPEVREVRITDRGDMNENKILVAEE